MLKETFKMRKIGKHLVNVSMLSLAVVPVIASSSQVLAQEVVKNDSSVYPTKIENDAQPSNTPDADGTYNSQIKSVELVNVSGNAYRYKITFHDGFSIPENGVIRLNSNLSDSSFRLDSTLLRDSSNQVMGRINLKTVPNNDLYGRRFDTVRTFSEFKEAWNGVNAFNYGSFTQFNIVASGRFSKLNKDRSFEFVVNRLSSLTYSGLNKNAILYTNGQTPTSFKELTSKSLDLAIGVGDKRVSAGSLTLNVSSSTVRSLKKSNVDYLVGSGSSYINAYNSFKSYGWPKGIVSSIAVNTNNILLSHGSNTVQTDGAPALFVKKGDVLKYRVPKGFRLSYDSNMSVGSMIDLSLTDVVPQETVVTGDRFSDTSDYKTIVDHEKSSNTRTIQARVTKLDGDTFEFVIDQDVYVEQGHMATLNSGVLSKLIGIELAGRITDVFSESELSEFSKPERSTYSLHRPDAALALMRDGKLIVSGNGSFFDFTKDRNLAVGDLTKGTVKVKYVDESGAELPNNPIETIAENKPWTEQITIVPKAIKGYKFVRADKDLTLKVGSGEQIVTLTYKQDITYIPDPKYNAGEKVPDPDDPSRIHVGTKPKVVEEDIPFKEEVRENPKLPKGTENVIQEGEKGKKTTTTTYTVDPKTGDVTPSEKVTTKDPKNRIIERGTGEDKDGDLVVNYIPDPENEPGKQTIVDEGKKPKLDVTGKVKDSGKPKVVKVGTKPKVVEEDIPFKEEVRENPKLPKGTENVIQEGEKGKKTTTTTYTLDDKTGNVTSTEKVTTKDPKNRIIERGTGEDKDGDLIVNYIPDPENEPGKQTIVDEGKKPKLDVTGKVKDQGKPKVIKVGTKPKVVEEDIPFKEEVRENPKLPKGTENVIQEGEKGKKKTTTIYTLDPKTGKVTSEDKVETKDPKNRIIERGTGEDEDGNLIVNYIPDPENEPGKETIVDEGKKPKLDITGKVKDPGKPKVIKVGTKPKVVEEDIPFKEEVRENPKLPKGTEFVIQEGEKGKKKITTTYTLDPKTGKVRSEDKVETKNPKNRIIERGTGEDVDGEIVVTYIPDPENEPGKQIIVDEGSKPKLDVTGKVKDSGKPKVIKVGTKPKVVEEDIPFKEEVRENPKLPKGTENVIQEGVKGKKTTTTTYTMDPKTGEVKPAEKVTTTDPKTRIIERGTGEDKDGDLLVKYIPDPEKEPGKQTIVDEGKKPKFDVTGKELDPGKPKVIKVGTKPKVVEEEVPFKEEVRENPELPEGERKVVQEGQVGKKTTTTTYTLDEKTGEVKESTTEKVDEPKVRIVEVGTKKPEAPKEEPKVETPKTTEVPKKEEPKVEVPKTEQPKTTEEPKVKETPKELPKTSEQAKQRNTAIIALLSVVGLGGLATYLGLRKRDEK